MSDSNQVFKIDAPSMIVDVQNITNDQLPLWRVILANGAEIPVDYCDSLSVTLPAVGKMFVPCHTTCPNRGGRCIKTAKNVNVPCQQTFYYIKKKAKSCR